jgi:Histidine kinase-, DNA gyrase B-, and HSP90-like ATPase
MSMKPESFPITVQGGMLEALGINMYTSLGKCLVEFVANAYDGNATIVDISIPIDEIASARATTRAAAKSEVARGTRSPFTVLLTPLPEAITVSVKDNGHGMSPEQIENKFLPLNRKRRMGDDGEETDLKSEGGQRFVMGRKGLGKLAGFGAAMKVRVETKRANETYSTTIEMDYSALGGNKSLADQRIPASYKEELDPEFMGTTITLSGLKSDSVKYSIDTIENTLREAFFGIDPLHFCIKINGVPIKSEDPDYEFCYPEGASASHLADSKLDVPDIGSFDLTYFVGIRSPGKNLPAAKRGARIYCNGRLAAGPSLFGLPTGMHNFHSQSYMECVVNADELDRKMIDFVNTNRTQLREDNEVVGALIQRVEEFMRRALAEHAKWRERAAAKEIAESEETAIYNKILARMPPKSRKAAERLLRSLAIQHGVKSKEFSELAPLVIDSMNAGEVLIRLSELGHEPKSIENISIQLRDLAEIEKSDALKLYRGRRSGIRALMQLADKGEDLWKKQGIEKELHTLLKTEPWLIRPEFSRYLSSDQTLTQISSTLAKHIEVDSFAPIAKVDGGNDITRPDLVFVLADSASPYAVTVVELKSPSLPLDTSHLTQLESYILKLQKWCQNELGRTVSVSGLLIGAMPDPDRLSDSSSLLIKRIQSAGLNSEWAVIGIRDLVQRALDTHLQAIQVLEKELREDQIADPDEQVEADGATPN